MINKKIILFIPAIEGGGVEKNLFSISNHFVKQFKEVVLITSGKKYKKKFHKIKIISPFINIEELESRSLKYLLCLFQLFLYLLFNGQKSLVFSFQANIYAIIIAKILSKKIVVRANSSPSGWSFNKIKFFIFRKIYQLSDGIIVNSDHFKKEFDKVFKVDSTCIYNPLNINEAKKFSKKSAPKIYNKKNSLKLLNIGRMVDQKDQITILKALKFIKEKYKFHNFELVIIGRGKLEYNLKKFIKHHILENQIKILPFKKNPYPYFKQADIFILSSKFEGLPNVMLEAAVFKKFIISSDCPTGPKEILKNGKFGSLFKIGDYKKLGSLIFENRKKNYTIKTNLCYKNLKKYNFQKNLNKYYKFIKSLN